MSHDLDTCNCLRCEYLQELELFRRLELVAPNGEIIRLNDEGRFTDSAGRYGYNGFFTGAWICYTDGAYCACLDWMEEVGA